jgi:hypothetical protein
VRIEWNDWLYAGREVSGPLLAGAPATFAQTVQRATSVARGAKHIALRAARLLGNDAIVVRRYQGTLGGGTVERVEPLDLVFVGREELARQFEVYFRADDKRNIDRETTSFRGSLAQFAVKKSAIARDAAEADILACEVFPGSFVHDDDFEHHPMLDAHLRVEATIEQQIRRVRSRAQRKLMRGVLRRGDYRDWVDSSESALETFRTTLHTEYVRARFGEWGMIEDSAIVRHMYARSGRILFVAARANPNQPVCATLLLDDGAGRLVYQYNGFLLAAERNERLMAERTAALELAVATYAIEQRFTRIAFGYTRAILSDGLLVHKRRLGCTFAPLFGSPLFRVHVKPGRRAAVLARFPLLVRGRGGWTAALGYDDASPRLAKRAWRAALKSYRVPGLARAVIWTNTTPANASDPCGEVALRQAVDEMLDLPDGVEFRRDE